MTREDGQPTTQQKQDLIAGVTDLFSNVMGRSGKTAVVTIEELSTDNYGIGGRTVTAIRREAASAKE
ncbi:MAG: tautomerase family protein [Desulfobacter sp.]